MTPWNPLRLDDVRSTPADTPRQPPSPGLGVAVHETFEKRNIGVDIEVDLGI